MNIDSLEHVSWIPFEAEMKHVFFPLFMFASYSRATESLRGLTNAQKEAIHIFQRTK